MANIKSESLLHRDEVDRKQHLTSPVSFISRNVEGEIINRRSDLLSPPTSQTLRSTEIRAINAKTPAELTKMLDNKHNIEMDRKLGMVNIEPIISSNDGEDIVDQMIDREDRMAARTAELEFRRNTFWKSCCDSVIDRRATVFFAQVGFASVVMMFVMAQLFLAEPYRCDGDDPTIYVRLITLIVGWFAPQPSMSN
jgi:hypothetical protein